MGTLAYLSPEQARGDEVDTRTDVFSFGVVLYQMATGRPAFSGESSAELIGAILHQTPVRPWALNPAIPGALERIILKSLEKNLAARYQSAGELLADLEECRRSSAAAPRTRRWLLGSAAGAAAALAAGAIFRQPRVDATSAEAQDLDHILRAFAQLNLLHCPDADFFQRLMIPAAGIPIGHAPL
jgi:Protein kinase domain